MFRDESGHSDLCVFVDHAWLDFVGVHFPATRYSTLVSLWVGAGLDVYAICLQNVFGHRVQSGWTIYFERRAPTRSPSCEDQVRITSGVVRMEVRNKSYLQVAGFQLRDAPGKNSGLRSAHDTRAEIDKIDTIADHDGGSGAGTIRIGHRRAGTEQYHLRARCALLWCLALRLLCVGIYCQQHEQR